MTEKDLEIQKLRRELLEARKAINQYKNLLRVLKSDLYKAVVYDCKCSLCAEVENCCRERIEENCFVWKKKV